MTVMETSVDLSIVIVNWNSRQFLCQCLRTVFAQRYDFRVEVIVIDNASFDGTDEMLAMDFPTVRFIQGRENIGFARANNAAFAASTGRAVLFLNPDTELLGDALVRMLAHLDANPDAGAIGCRLLNTDGSLQTSCVQPFPTILNQVFDAEILRRRFPRAAWWGMRALFDEQGGVAHVEAISGACLLVSRATFERVGRFSADYFMYAEDLDLCFKLDRAGLRNYYVGDVTVIHHGGQSTTAKTESQFGNVLMRESVFRYLRLHRGGLYAGLYRLAIGGAAILRLGILAATLILTAGRWSRQSLENGLRKWRKVLLWSLGRERWAAGLGAGSR
jgi:GT2 family glycosyltransferase